MTKTEFKNGPDLAGWAIATGVALVAFGVAVLVGGFDLTPAILIASVIFLVVGVILGMPAKSLPGPGEVVLRTPAAPVAGGVSGGVAKTSAVKTAELLSAAPVAASATLPVTTRALEGASATPAAVVTPVSFAAPAPVATPASVATPAPVTTPAPVATPAAASQPAAVGAVAVPATAFMASLPEAATAAEVSEPARLTAARGGRADDLKEIEGIGPALEKLCNDLGFYHFDQIAHWSDADVVWVDANMAKFKGRITRDKWVPQAKLIVAEGLDAFRMRNKTNDY